VDYDKNVQYWQGRYNAPNVESFIFRFYGRILKHDFNIDGANHEKIFDFGCGEGAALKFFAQQGFDVYGVDIAEQDILAARQWCIPNHLEVIQPNPTINQRYLKTVHGNSQWIDIAISIQTLDFLSDSDCEIVLNNIYEQMKPGSVIFASISGYKMYYRDHGKYLGDGLWHCKFKNDRVEYDLNLNFVETKEKLLEKFHMFYPKYVDFYDSSFRNEGSEFRWTFTGIKK